MKNNKTMLSMLSIFFFMLMTGFTSLALAGSSPQDAEKIELKPGHPQQYTVVKGDTLWDISGKFLKKPWYWPEIWQMNQQIENPHLIYPGDVLTLVYIDGKPYIRHHRGKRTVKLSPKTRVEDLGQAIPTIPLDIISPYLTSNRIIGIHEYTSAPYIVGINEELLSAGADNKVYVMGIDKNTLPGTRHAVYRTGGTYRDPANPKRILGHEAIYVGEGILERTGSPEHRNSPATLYIQKSKAEILKGYRVLPVSTDTIVDTSFIPKPSRVQRPGRIIGVLTSGIQPGVKMVGALDVVIVDMGDADGVEKGDVFNIYKKGSVVKDNMHYNSQVKLPDEINGTLMIFRPFKHLSYALVMEAQSALSVGDVIHSPFFED